MKDFLTKPADGETAAKTPAAEEASTGASALAAQVQASPRLAAQRRQLQGLRPPSGGGLPAQLKSGMEALSGMDLSDVRVHTNSSKPAQLNALAHAQGNHIHLGPGQERHLPHEAWHVVQQRQGRVAPTTAMGGTQVNDDPRLEAEADRMGAIAQRMRVDAATARGYQGTGATGDVAQLRTQVNYESQNFAYPGIGGPRTEKIGKTMDAYLDPQDPIRGAPTDAKEIDGLMKYLADVYPAGSRGWHRGHLLNAKLGGLNIPSNLAPFTNAMNTGAHSVIEDSVKRLVGIGIPTRYLVAYSLTGNAQAVTPKLTMKVEPVPVGDDQQEDLDIREIPPVQEYTISARTLAYNVNRRPRSPQPAQLGLGDGTSVIPVQDDYSKFQDRRILEKGWGTLERETRSGKRKAAALKPEDRQRVEQTLDDNGGRLFADTVIGTAAYTTDFWLNYTRGNHVYTRSNRDTVDEAIHKISHVREYVTLDASGLLTRRFGQNPPPRNEWLQRIYTRANGSEVWYMHDGQLNTSAYVTLSPDGQTILHNHGQAAPGRYTLARQIYTRRNGDQVWESHDGEFNATAYVTVDTGGSTVLQNHGPAVPWRYDLIRQRYTRSNGDEVWESHDGEYNALAYLTTDAGGHTVLQDHGPLLPDRHQSRLVYTRRNGNQVYFSHDGQTNVSGYITTDPSGSHILQAHGQIKPSRYEPVRKIYTRQNGNQVWESHDGEVDATAYVTTDAGRKIVQHHGDDLPDRYEFIQPLPDLGNGVERWTAHDGATNQIVQLQFTRS
jgi:hypothetical protein